MPDEQVGILAGVSETRTWVSWMALTRVRLAVNTRPFVPNRIEASEPDTTMAVSCFATGGNQGGR